MSATPVIAVFDVGKTNKKLFLFDERYHIVFEKSARFTETVDEDGDPCENLASVQQSVFDSMQEVAKLKEFAIQAVNFSAYGASLIYTGKDGKPLTPLYNYLKPYPEALSGQLYKKYGGDELFSLETASPVLGSLNSGLQLYRLKQQQPEIFARLKYAMHLPQYLSFLLTGQACSDITSIGCHTAMWNFERDQYHDWVNAEGLASKLAPVRPSATVFKSTIPGADYKVGIGLHDSSAALIPYLVNFKEPFVLLSTGTWNISLNPFNPSPLTIDELKQDCLCYLQYQGRPVKASRLFSGFAYEQQTRRIAEHFNIDAIKFRNIIFDPHLIGPLKRRLPQNSNFADRELSAFDSDTEAYYQLMLDLVRLQAVSTGLVLKGCPVKRIFVDGGFSRNSVFMHLLAAAFPKTELYAASMAQATAVGAALAIHGEWNSMGIPNDIIELKYYSAHPAIAAKP